MNLEAVEQRCLAHLQEAPRPLVPIDQLLCFVHNDEDCSGITATELLGFLRKHDLFTVIEPQALPADARDRTALRDAGFITSPNVILKTRIPADADVPVRMQQEMGTMLNALEAALNQARGDKKPRLAMEVQCLLKRARELQKKIEGTGPI